MYMHCTRHAATRQHTVVRQLGNSTEEILSRCVIKQAALNCAQKYSADEEKQRPPMRTAMMAGFSTGPRAKKANTTVTEMRRACVARGAAVH